MKQLKTAIYFALAVGLLLPLTGCGKKKPDGLPDLNQTTLTIIVDGKGLEGANVTLQPADSQGNKWVPSGTTDSSGKVEMKTSGFKGAPAGSYKVVVSAKEEIDYGEDGPPPAKDELDALEKWNRSAHPNTWKRYSPIDVKYTNVADTPLEITIQSGKNAQEFDLGSSGKTEVKQEDK